MAKAPKAALNALPTDYIDVAQLTQASTYQISDIYNHDLTVLEITNALFDASAKFFKTAMFMRADGQPIENDAAWQTLRQELLAIDRTPQGRLIVTRNNTTGMVTMSWP